MAVYGKDEKRCATCIYWRGKRNVEFQYIETNECDGKCGCSDGFYNIRTTQSSACSDWNGFSNKEDN